jgi:hypothetical protein
MVITKLQFLSRFTDQETAGILAASDSNPALRVYLFRLQMAQEVDLQNESTIVGVQLLEYAGLIGTSRAAQIICLGIVRILAPFNESYPETYEIYNKDSNNTITLESGATFAQPYWELI